MYIFSGPTHTGKTTLLEKWIDKMRSVDGILTPVKNNKRYIKYISSGEMYLLESNSNDSELMQQIGKYKFRTDLFEHAQKYLLSLVDKKPEWIIIDEIGFLELNKQGLEPGVSKLIQRLEGKRDVNLLLVIRNYLKEEVINYYKLNVNDIKDFELE